EGHRGRGGSGRTGGLGHASERSGRHSPALPSAAIPSRAQRHDRGDVRPETTRDAGSRVDVKEGPSPGRCTHPLGTTTSEPKESVVTYGRTVHVGGATDDVRTVMRWPVSTIEAVASLNDVTDALGDDGRR